MVHSSNRHPPTSNSQPPTSNLNPQIKPTPHPTTPPPHPPHPPPPTSTLQPQPPDQPHPPPPHSTTPPLHPAPTSFPPSPTANIIFSSLARTGSCRLVRCRCCSFSRFSSSPRSRAPRPRLHPARPS